MHAAGRFALNGGMSAYARLHAAAAHADDGGAAFAAFAIEQGQRVARLQAQNLGVARRAVRQIQLAAFRQGLRHIQTRRGGLRFADRRQISSAIHSKRF